MIVVMMPGKISCISSTLQQYIDSNDQVTHENMFLKIPMATVLQNLWHKSIKGENKPQKTRVLDKDDYYEQNSVNSLALKEACIKESCKN